MWHKLNEQFKDREPARGYTLQQKLQESNLFFLVEYMVEYVVGYSIG